MSTRPEGFLDLDKILLFSLKSFSEEIKKILVESWQSHLFPEITPKQVETLQP